MPVVSLLLPTFCDLSGYVLSCGIPMQFRVEIGFGVRVGGVFLRFWRL